MITRTGFIKRAGVLLMAVPCFAHAVLGGAPATTTAAQTALKASAKAAGASQSSNAAFTVNTLQTSLGTTITEYVGTDGKVFAVSWTGPQMPDLRTLLGTYFTQVSENATVRHAGHSANLVNTSDLVVQSGGKPLAYHGRAWVPAMLPAGVSTDDIQ
ncbi:DUF2844 domain-containing protein [Silvimonas iriomotensis]|uniref:DUF2844 domain-containing protein n=1 Tax=Silvimonas iriomotensis TaxID=449662 RepID=A0ABQ2P885_9NEIS|nr:DUF2844 domain-containing protein [Silvimonas iriomotensis]GGP20660.1 hypothetical protein GCM10010970_16320 [Silvimonas iriomotensis]